MDQYKVLDRLKYQLRSFAKYGYWQDGDEVIDAIRASQFKRQDYLCTKRKVFQKEVEWMPDNLAENRYFQMLKSLSSYWEVANLFLNDPHAGCGEFKDVAELYSQEIINYAIITYYHYLLIEDKETTLDFYSLFDGLDPDQASTNAANLGLCKSREFNALDQRFRSPIDTQARSKKAQETIRKEAAESLEDLIDTVCKKLQKEKLVTKNGDSWRFIGNEEQYAYLGLFFAEYQNKERIDWQVISSAITFDGSNNTYRRYASEMRNNKRSLPEGRVKIRSAFPNKK